MLDGRGDGGGMGGRPPVAADGGRLDTVLGGRAMLRYQL